MFSTGHGISKKNKPSLENLSNNVFFLYNLQYRANLRGITTKD